MEVQLVLVWKHNNLCFPRSPACMNLVALPCTGHEVLCTNLCLTVASPAQGTVNLVALARQRSLKKFVLVTSIGTDDFFNVLNLFFLVL